MTTRRNLFFSLIVSLSLLASTPALANKTELKREAQRIVTVSKEVRVSMTEAIIANTELRSELRANGRCLGQAVAAAPIRQISWAAVEPLARYGRLDATGRAYRANPAAANWAAGRFRALTQDYGAKAISDRRLRAGVINQSRMAVFGRIVPVGDFCRAVRAWESNDFSEAPRFIAAEIGPGVLRGLIDSWDALYRPISNADWKIGFILPGAQPEQFSADPLVRAINEYYWAYGKETAPPFG